MDERKLSAIKSLINSILANEPTDEELNYDDNAIQMYTDLHSLKESMDNCGINGYSNIIFKDDYIATKLWCREDVEQELIENGYKGTDEEIDAVIRTGFLKVLGDCTDSDWYTIDYAIEFVANKEGWIRESE